MAAVFWDARAGKYTAQVRVDGGKQHVGYFDDEAEARDAAESFRPRPSWEQRVVASLCESKRSGLTFRAGWKLALRLNPPRARDIGSPGGTLFEVDGSAHESLIDAFERYCEDAWHGRRPRLAGFSLELLRSSDGSQAARRGRLRSSAA